MPKLIFSFDPQVRCRIFFTEKMEEYFDPTDESDYIYNGNTIIYYIGSKKRPVVPSSLDGVQVRTIEITAFNGTGIEAVRLPEGMEVIS